MKDKESLTILKFKVTFDVGMYVPRVFKYLDIAFQEGSIYLWAIVAVDCPVDRRIVLKTYYTGQEIENTSNLKYIKTLLDDGLVYHIFEVIE